MATVSDAAAEEGNTVGITACATAGRTGRKALPRSLEGLLNSATYVFLIRPTSACPATAVAGDRGSPGPAVAGDQGCPAAALAGDDSCSAAAVAGDEACLPTALAGDDGCLASAVAEDDSCSPPRSRSLAARNMAAAAASACELGCGAAGGGGSAARSAVSLAISRWNSC